MLQVTQSNHKGVLIEVVALTEGLRSSNWPSLILEAFAILILTSSQEGICQ